jgi:hypothetical protein
MDSLYLKWLKSPIEGWETVKFLRELQQWNQGELIIVNWRDAMVTAVYDSAGTVYMLSSNPATNEWSIPVDDSHNPPVKRSALFFRSPVITPDKYDNVVWIAAYKFVSAPWVAGTHEARAVEVLAQ